MRPPSSHRRSRSMQSPPSDDRSYLGAGSSSGTHRRTSSSTPISIQIQPPVREIDTRAPTHRHSLTVMYNLSLDLVLTYLRPPNVMECFPQICPVTLCHHRNLNHTTQNGRHQEVILGTIIRMDMARPLLLGMRQLTRFLRLLDILQIPLVVSQCIQQQLRPCRLVMGI